MPVIGRSFFYLHRLWNLKVFLCSLSIFFWKIIRFMLSYAKGRYNSMNVMMPRWAAFYKYVEMKRWVLRWSVESPILVMWKNITFFEKYPQFSNLWLGGRNLVKFGPRSCWMTPCFDLILRSWKKEVLRSFRCVNYVEVCWTSLLARLGTLYDSLHF